MRSISRVSPPADDSSDDTRPAELISGLDDVSHGTSYPFFPPPLSWLDRHPLLGVLTIAVTIMGVAMAGVWMLTHARGG